MKFKKINRDRCSIYCGNFDSENFWRREGLAKLPSFSNRQLNRILQSMDELQFVFAQKEDFLVTRYSMKETQMQYLRQIGYDFGYNTEDVIDRYSDDRMDAPNFQLICENTELTGRLKGKVHKFDPFSVIPYAITLEDELKTGSRFPPYDTVVKVNSKFYSNRVKEILGLKYCGKVVGSCDELERTAGDLLNCGPIIIKDEFGVSGKGNIMVKSKVSLKSIISYIRRQEERHSAVGFLVEPFLNKILDFSCQFYISEDGKAVLLSLQKVINNHFEYSGSILPGKRLLDRLENEGYFEVMEKVAGILHSDGYFGHVCVDSMILESGEIVPVVEINARKSMSLIKHCLDEKLSGSGLMCNFAYLPVSYDFKVRYDDFLSAMKKDGILYEQGGRKGIIPLSANAFLINQETDGQKGRKRSCKGRLYYSGVGVDFSTAMEQSEVMKKFLAGRGFKI